MNVCVAEIGTWSGGTAAGQCGLVNMQFMDLKIKQSV